MEPITRKEQYYDGMINDTPVPDPITREEHFLKDIADKIAQGGGGGATSVTLAASGDNLSGDISLADLKTALSNGVVLLSFPTDGNADERVVAEYTDDSTNGLRIGVFSEDEYIVYSVVDDGNDGVTLTVVSEADIGVYYMEDFTELSTAFENFIAAAVPKIMQAPNTLVTAQGNTAYSGTEVQNAINAMKKGKTVFIPSVGGFVTANSYSEDTVNNEFYIGFDFKFESILIAPNTTMRIMANLDILKTATNIAVRGVITGALNT